MQCSSVYIILNIPVAKMDNSIKMKHPASKVYILIKFYHRHDDGSRTSFPFLIYATYMCKHAWKALLICLKSWNNIYNCVC